MEDVAKSIKAYLYDRASGPLYGILVFVFIAVHYDIVIYFISGIPPEEKIKMIRSCLSTERTITVLISSLCIILLGPILSTASYWWWSMGDMVNKRIKFKRDGKVPVSLAESMELRKRIKSLDSSILAMQEDGRRQIERLEFEKQALQSQLNEAEEGRLKATEEFNSLRRSIDKSKSEHAVDNHQDILGNQDLCKLLHSMASDEGEGKTTKNLIAARKMARNRNEADVYLKRLHSLGYLETSNKQDYYISDRGRAYVQWSETEGRKADG